MHILASENIGQAFRRYSYFKNLSTQMNKEAKEIRLMQEDLLKEKEVLASMKSDAQAVKAERVSDLEKLRKEEAQADNVVKKLKKNKKLMPKKHVPTVRYLSTNTKVATVTSKGKIKGVKAGTCYVYAYAHNGVFKKITVTVK